MKMGFAKRPLILLAAIAVLWLGIRYILPVMLPFAAGLFLALAAEPLVGMAQKRLLLGRSLASGLGVSVTLLLLCGILTLLGALLVKELGRLAGVLPDVGQTVQQGLTMLQNVLTDAAEKAPAGMQPMLTGSVARFFQDGTALTEQVTRKVPAALTAVLGWVPDGALGLGTALLSAFMISGRLPNIRKWVAAHLPESWHSRYLPALRRCRKALGGWLKAQLKLSAVTFAIVGIGFMLLRIPYGIGWAGAVALVDAVPVLGTGTVLVPWALVCLLQQNHLRAIGLLVIYGIALVTRTALEPRLVGRHLGLDPLLTLLALYLGYRFWGIPGMILAPLLATAAKSLTDPQEA